MSENEHSGFEQPGIFDSAVELDFIFEMRAPERRWVELAPVDGPILNPPHYETTRHDSGDLTPIMKGASE